MKIIPAIDLQNGSCVRLAQGDFSAATQYSADPLTVAKQFLTEGAQFLHLVDLDGAKAGEPKQLETILSIVRNTPLKIQIGGGIRTKQSVQTLLQNGVDRVVIGSLAANHSNLVCEWLEEFGISKITIAMDVRLNSDGIPFVATEGWKETGSVSLWKILSHYQTFSDLQILCTDIAKDGMLIGPNFFLYKQLAEQYPSFKIQASGGVTSLEDLKKLREIGVESTIIGKALYEKRFTLSEALKC